MRFEAYVKPARILAVILVLLVLFISSKKLISDPSPAKGDLGVYLHAARQMFAGENIYSTPTHPESEGGLYYIYPPLFAALFIPFTFLHVDVTIVIWCLLNLVLIGWILKAFFEFVADSPFFDLPVKTRWIIGFFPILLSSRFILHHLDRGQANILEMALVVLAIKLCMNRNPLSAGAVIGASVVIKLITLPFTFLFLLERNKKAIAGVFAGMLLALMLPAIIIGFDENWLYLRSWFDNFVLDSSQRESKLGLSYNVSPTAQLYRFFSDVTAFEHKGQQYSLMIFQSSAAAIRAADWIVRFALVGIFVFYWFRYRNGIKILSKGAIALLLVLTPLLFPTAQKSYFVFLLPGYIYVVYVWYCLKLKDRWFRGFTAASFLIASGTTDGIWGNFMGDFFIAAGCFIYGTLLLAGAIFRAAKILSEEREGILK
ncbi:hypothetical protein BH18ACI3_BH18ACI3_15010 [soil metagenome]